MSNLPEVIQLICDKLEFLNPGSLVLQSIPLIVNAIQHIRKLIKEGKNADCDIKVQK